MEINCYDCVYCKLFKEGHICVWHSLKITNKHKIPCKKFILKGGY